LGSHRFVFVPAVFREKDKSGRDVKGVVWDDTQGPKIDMQVTGCEFRNLQTKARGGSAIYMMRTGTVNIANRYVDKYSVCAACCSSHPLSNITAVSYSSIITLAFRVFSSTAFMTNDVQTHVRTVVVSQRVSR
jgi:hypothetical protein